MLNNVENNKNHHKEKFRRCFDYFRIDSLNYPVYSRGMAGFHWA